MALKQRISSPLEAGRSILDEHNLPPYLTGPLEFTSKRLARKGLHITLVVVRNDYQISTSVPTPASPPMTPGFSNDARSSSRFTSSMTGIKHLVRRGTGSSITSDSSTTTSEPFQTAVSSPSFPPQATESLASPRRWIFPPTPGRSPPRTPITPLTPASIASSSSSSSSRGQYTQQPSLSDTYGIRLIYTDILPPKVGKSLRAMLLRAEQKFGLSASRQLLPPPTTASAYGLDIDLIRRSILQNEVLFSSEGLTLLSLDRQYTFKAALAAYSRSLGAVSSVFASSTSAIVNTSASSSSLSPLTSPRLLASRLEAQSHTRTPTVTSTMRCLEDAVDSLRRLVVLSNGGRPVSRSDLHRSYDWIGVNSRALAEVERMYRKAYGGPEGCNAFLDTTVTAVAVTEEEGKTAVQAHVTHSSIVNDRMPVVKISTPPRPKTRTPPILKLNTNVAPVLGPRIVKPKPRSSKGKPVLVSYFSPDTPCAPIPEFPTPKKEADRSPELGVDDSEQIEIKIEEYHPTPTINNRSETLRVAAAGRPTMLSMTIDEMMLLQTPIDSNQGRHSKLGPTTPNGYDDISPITRGEWGFLFKGDSWRTGRTVAVETC